LSAANPVSSEASSDSSRNGASAPSAAAAQSGAEAFQPFVPASQSPPELTFPAAILGSILGVVFGASSVYLALKVGITVSASIPIAVLSIAIFRKLRKGPSILENNMVQTIGSAGESIAAGVVFTIPALLLMGYKLEIGKTTLIALTGGWLGVLLMIPLRRALIVKEHGTLTYPEGRACAEVLEAGERGGSSARTVVSGFAVGFLYKFLQKALYLWKETPAWLIKGYAGASVEMEASPELLGVGYIVGPRVGGIMMAGGVLSYLVLMPAIKFFGGGLAAALYPALAHDGTIAQMGPDDLHKFYVYYIGAGAVAAGGLISLLRALPTIVSSFGGAVTSLRETRSAKKSGQVKEVARTERDLSITVTVGGSVGLILLLIFLPGLHINPIAAVLIIVFGFFFTTVSSRICGQIGSSSNPISGMTIATLLVTCFLFVLVGWDGPSYRPLALTVAAVVCIATANAGGTSQDLKTGFLVGATPRRQQIGLLIGVTSSALAVGWTLYLLNRAYTTTDPVPAGQHISAEAQPDGSTSVNEPTAGGGTVAQHYTIMQEPVLTQGGLLPGRYLVDDQGMVHYKIDPGIGGSPKPPDGVGPERTKLEAPKPTLMAFIIDGILTRKMPWALVLIGVFISITLELSAVDALPFAVGLYLPLSTSAPIWVGGLVRALIDRRRRKRLGPKRGDGDGAGEGDAGRGVLVSSGLIAGGAICGLAVAAIAILKGSDQAFGIPFAAGWIDRATGAAQNALGSLLGSNVLALVVFALMGAWLFRIADREDST
jgi:putative OPT family oligopeptide transporter